MKLDKNTWRVVWYMQKVTEYDDLPSDKKPQRYQRLLNYKKAMLEAMQQ